LLLAFGGFLSLFLTRRLCLIAGGSQKCISLHSDHMTTWGGEYIKSRTRESKNTRAGPDSAVCQGSPFRVDHLSLPFRVFKYLVYCTFNFYFTFFAFLMFFATKCNAGTNLSWYLNENDTSVFQFEHNPGESR